MLMPLLVRLTDSEIKAVDRVLSQVLNGVRHGGGILEKGRFVWPQTRSGTVTLTNAQLSMLLEGIDWRMPAWTARPEVAI